MSTQALYSPPSDEELAREIRQYAPKLTIYQGGDEWFEFEKAGVIWRMPPDLGGKKIRHKDTGLIYVANGEIQLQDRYGRMQDPLRRRFTGAMGVEQGNEAISIMKYALQQYGERGIVWIRGDGKDDGRKQAARTLYRNHRRGWAEAQQAARSRVVESFDKNPTNANKPRPAPTNDQRKAQKLLDALADEGRKLYEFVCEYGCSDFDVFSDFKRHMKVNHNKDVADVAHARPEDDDNPDAEGPDPLIVEEELLDEGAPSSPTVVLNPAFQAAIEQANALAATQAATIAALEERMAALEAEKKAAAAKGGKGRAAR